MKKTPETQERGTENKGTCPFDHVATASAYILEQCREIFGDPKIQKLNRLGGINGEIFPDFLENFLHTRLSQIEIPNPGQMKKVTLVGIDDNHFFADISRSFLENTSGKYVSALAYYLYTKFVKENISKVTSSDVQMGFINRLHFSNFSLTFVQAFDSIFMSALPYARSKEEWNQMKKSMWRVVLNLARIPTNIQEGMTSSSERIGHMYGANEPYFLEHMREIWDIQIGKIGIQQAHRDTFEKIEIDGGYSVCPALHDGVMKRSFEALHEIYGQIFFR